MVRCSAFGCLVHTRECFSGGSRRHVVVGYNRAGGGGELMLEIELTVVVTGSDRASRMLAEHWEPKITSVVAGNAWLAPIAGCVLVTPARQIKLARSSDDGLARVGVV